MEGTEETEAAEYWQRKGAAKKQSPLMAVVETSAIVVALRFVLNLLWVGVGYFPELGLPRLDDGLVSTLITIASVIIYFIAGWHAAQRKLSVEYAAKSGIVAGILVALTTYAVRRNGVLGENLVPMDLLVRIVVEALMGAIVVATGAWAATLVHKKEEEDEKRIRA